MFVQTRPFLFGTALVLASLSTYAALNQDDPIFVTVSDDIFVLQESDVDNSQWSDRSMPPPLDLVAVLAKSNDVCRHLDAQRETTGFHNWETESITLQSARSFNHDECVYGVELWSTEFRDGRGIKSVRRMWLFVLMDGTILVDADNYSELISDAVLSHPDVFKSSVGASTRDTIRTMRRRRQERWGGGLF